jgi:hypothetical protein
MTAPAPAAGWPCAVYEPAWLDVWIELSAVGYSSLADQLGKRSIEGSTM